MRVATEAFAKVDEAEFAEGEDGFAGAGVDLLKVVVEGEDEAAVLMVFGFPTGNAAGCEAGEVGVDPDFMASGGVQRDEGIVLRKDVHNVVDDEGVEEISSAVSCGIGPGDLKMGYV